MSRGAGSEEPAPESSKPQKKRSKTTEVSEAKPPPSTRKGTVKVGGKSTGNTRMRNHSSIVKESLEDQAEFFLRKFNRHDNVDRAAVMKLRSEFEKFDTFGKRELDDTQAMRMLEARGQPHSLCVSTAPTCGLSYLRSLSVMHWTRAQNGNSAGGRGYEA